MTGTARIAAERHSVKAIRPTAYFYLIPPIAWAPVPSAFRLNVPRMRFGAPNNEE